MMPRHGESFFINREGVKFYTSYRIPSDPKALIVVVHGLCEHSGRYRDVADEFSQRGYAVALYDQRGHGLSDGRRGDIDRFGRWVDDLHAFVMESRRRIQRDIPTVVMGHSLGGLIAMHCAIQYYDDMDAIVASAPAIQPTIRVAPWKIKLGTRAARLFPRCTVNACIDPRDLSRDPKAVSSFEEDRLVLRTITLRAGNEILDASADAMQLAYHIAHPILMIQGREDRICSAKATRTFFDNIIHPRKKLCLYDGAFHEPFNDVVRDQVYEDLDRWLNNLVGERAPTEASRTAAYAVANDPALGYSEKPQ